MDQRIAHLQSVSVARDLRL